MIQRCVKSVPFLSLLTSKFFGNYEPFAPNNGSVINPAFRRSKCACEGIEAGTTIEPFWFLRVHSSWDKLNIWQRVKPGRNNRLNRRKSSMLRRSKRSLAALVFIQLNRVRFIAEKLASIWSRRHRGYSFGRNLPQLLWCVHLWRSCYDRGGPCAREVEYHSLEWGPQWAKERKWSAKTMSVRIIRMPAL